jgi:hypothetical protein
VNRDAVILSVFNDPELKSLAKVMMRNKTTWRDLHSMMIAAVCEMPDELLKGLNEGNRLKNTCYAIMRNQAFNPRSKFSKQFHDPRLIYWHESGLDAFVDVVRDTDDEAEVGYDIDQMLNLCVTIASDPSEMIYDKMCADIMRLYIEMPISIRNYRNLQKQTGIHYSSISTYIKHIRKRYDQSLCRLI